MWGPCLSGMCNASPLPRSKHQPRTQPHSCPHSNTDTLGLTLLLQYTIDTYSQSHLHAIGFAKIKWRREGNCGKRSSQQVGTMAMWGNVRTRRPGLQMAVSDCWPCCQITTTKKYNDTCFPSLRSHLSLLWLPLICSAAVWFYPTPKIIPMCRANISEKLNALREHYFAVARTIKMVRTFRSLVG